MDGLTGDLQTKYHKVATEYSKVRAQAAVLKKAVLDEQTKNSELRDVLKEREQSLRKAEQEMDSLAFRNQQLTKRVTVLQEELDTVSKSKKGRTKPSDTSPDSSNEVMGEELHKTITENAKLLSLLHDKDDAHRQDVEHLTQRIEHLEHELRKQHEHYKIALAKMETEKASAVAAAISTASSAVNSSSNSTIIKERGDQQRIETLQRSNLELAAHSKELNSQRIQLTSQLEDATRIIRTHLPFVDSSDRELNELNVPHHDCGQQALALHTVSLAGKHVEELAGAFEELHTHMRQRLLVLHGSLSPLNLKFSEHLQDSGRQLHQLKQGYLDFQKGLEGETWTLDTAPSLIAFSGPLRSFCLFLQKLQPYHQLSMEEECILLGASEDFHAASRDVVSNSAHFSVQITKISGYVQILAGQNRRRSQHSVESQQRFLKELYVSFQTLHQAIQDLLCSYTVKFALEQENGGVPGNVQEETDGILRSLTSAVSSSGKLADVFEGYQTSLQKSPQSHTQSHPTVINYRKRAAHYLASLDHEEPQSVPYQEALLERGKVRTKTESCKALTAQLLHVQEQAAQAEREREHWQQEYHLLYLQQEQKDESSTTAETSPHVSSSSVVLADSSEGDGNKTVVTNLLGKLTTPFMPPAEVKAREQNVKEYFRGRLNELVTRCQNSEARATTFISECAVLKARLEDAVQGQKISDERAVRLSEELATTTQGYDSQLAVMSEHLANMNEKLALQRDTIDHLKFQNVQTKGSKKGKSK